MANYITATYPVEIKNSRRHRFLIKEGDECILGEDIEQQYSFNSDINRIALVESPFDNCVLIITSLFNVRYGVWNNIKDAASALENEEIVAYCVTINGKKEYIVAGIEDNVEDVCFSLVDLKHTESLTDEDIIIAEYNVPIEGKKRHRFFFELTDDYFDADDIDSTYELKKDFDKIAIVKSPLYPKVLLVSQRFKLMLTNWDSKEEALEYIEYDELEAHYVHINGKPVCLIADHDEDLSDVYLQIPSITPASENTSDQTYIYKQPTYDEDGDVYSREVKALSCPDFSDIQQLSVDYMNELSYEKKEELFDKIEHGLKILTSQEQLHAYMYFYGKMHECKLKKAFEEIPKSFFNHNSYIEVIDYACGQGIATFCLQDYIDYKMPNVEIKRICLIDPSSKALSRAALLCHKNSPKSAITTICSDFDNLKYKDIPRNVEFSTVHLLSNILDMNCYDIENLAYQINKIKKKGDIFICADPWYHDKSRDGRHLRLRKLLSGKEIYHECFNVYQLDADKKWTAIITVFRV